MADPWLPQAHFDKVGKLSSADLSTMDTLVDYVEADKLFSCDNATESITMSEFCTKVPKAVLLLTDLTESLWECTDEDWLNPVIAPRKQPDQNATGFAERLPVPKAGDQPPPDGLDVRAGSTSPEGAACFTNLKLT